MDFYGFHPTGWRANSTAVTLPAWVVEALHLRENDEIALEVAGDRIVLTRATADFQDAWAAYQAIEPLIGTRTGNWLNRSYAPPAAQHERKKVCARPVSPQPHLSSHSGRGSAPAPREKLTK